MAYLPKGKYKVKYTNGGEFKLKNKLTSYKGDYIELLDGGFYAGDSLNNLKGELVRIPPQNSSNLNLNNPNNAKYALLKPTITKEQANYTPIITQKPKPTLSDYNEGSFNRYIAIKVNTKEYIEVSKEVAEDLSKGKHDNHLYGIIAIKWSLKLNSAEINSKYLLDLETYLPGISDFFPDKDQYQLKEGTITISKQGLTRMYPNGTIISPKLPISYKLDNRDTIKCANCIFNTKNFCNRWTSDIKNNYSCSSFEGKSKKA